MNSEQQNVQAVLDAQNTTVNRLKDQLKRLQIAKSSHCGGCGEKVLEQIQKELTQECHKLNRMVDYIVRNNKVMHVKRTLDLARELSEDNVGGTPNTHKASEAPSIAPLEAAAVDNLVKDRLIDCLKTRVSELEGKITEKENVNQNNPLESETESEVSGKIEEVWDPLELQKLASNALIAVDQKGIVEEIKESLKNAEKKLAEKQRLPDRRDFNQSHISLPQNQAYNYDHCLPPCKDLRVEIKNISNERDTLRAALSEHEYSIEILKARNELLEELFQESKLQIRNLQDEMENLKKCRDK